MLLLTLAPCGCPANQCGCRSESPSPSPPDPNETAHDMASPSPQTLTRQCMTWLPPSPPPPDPNETAHDMVDIYRRECSSLRVKPISKLLEQLEVPPPPPHLSGG